MKTKRFMTTTIVLLLVLFYAPVIYAEKTVTLKWAHIAPQTPSMVVAPDQFFADQVEKRTNGKVKIDIFWSGTLGKANETLNLLKAGAIEVGSFYTGMHDSAFPIWSAPNSLYFVMTTIEEANQVALQMAELPAVKNEFEKQKVKLLFHRLMGSYMIFSKKPITKIEHFKGLKIRTFGSYLPRAMKAVGAVGVKVATSDIYESLHRGVIDAALWSDIAGFAFKIHEVAPNVCKWDVGSIVAYGSCINLKTWNTLANEIQTTIEGVMKDTQSFVFKHAIQMEKVLEQKMKEGGAIIHEISTQEKEKLKNASPDFLAEWVKKLEKTGKGPEVKEARKLWLEIVEKY